jgi:hypothetical protein
MPNNTTNSPSESFGCTGQYTPLTGVVEDRMDPEKMGRVKIRVFGPHSSNKDNVDTKCLPWATVSLPTTSPGHSGLGTVPFLTEGSWVTGYFRDGPSSQDPIITGSIQSQCANPSFYEKGFIEDRGFFDPNGIYPKVDYRGCVDYSRMARNDLDEVVTGVEEIPPEEGEDHHYTKEEIMSALMARGYEDIPKAELDEIIKTISEGNDQDIDALGEKLAEKGYIPRQSSNPNEYNPGKKVIPEENISASPSYERNVVQWKRKNIDDVTDEPQTKYDPVYPFNKTYISESGHIIEIDDTHTKERIHVFHRSGTFIEFHPSGDRVARIINDDYEIILQDKYLRVRGDLKIHVDGNADIGVRGNMNTTVMGDANYDIGGSVNWKVGESFNIATKESVNISGMNSVGIVAGKAMSLSSQTGLNITTCGILDLVGSKILLNSSTRKCVDLSDFEINALSEYVALPEEKFWCADDAPERTTQINKEVKNGTILYPPNTEKIENPNEPPPVEKMKNETPTVPPKEQPHPPTNAEKTPDNIDCGNIPDKIDYNMKVSSNLTLGQVVLQRDLVAQVGLSVKQIICNIITTANTVYEPLREKYGGDLLLTSGFRRGEAKSFHNKGLAMDFQWNSLNKSSSGIIEGYYKKSLEVKGIIPFDKEILEYKRTNKFPVIHVQIQQKNSGNRGELYTQINDKFHPGLRTTSNA